MPRRMGDLRADENIEDIAAQCPGVGSQGLSAYQIAVLNGRNYTASIMIV